MYNCHGSHSKLSPESGLVYEAPGVIGAFVAVNAEGAGVVQLETTRAHALEAPVSVLAGPRRRTQALIIKFNIMGCNFRRDT